MKAIVRREYGSPDVLRLEEIEPPTPGDGEVLIKVYAVSVNAADWHLLRGEPFLARLAFGLFKPAHQVLGADVAGRVEAVGPGVAQFRPGDEIFGDISGLGSSKRLGFGGLAEYACAPETSIVSKPANLTFEEAAAVPMAGMTALQGLRDHGHLQSGMKVMIHGASGGVGTFAVQLAKSFGAEVTAVCSTKSVDVVRGIGADHVIDYTKEDFTQSGQRYDLIFAAGGDRSIFELRRALAPRGIYVMAGGSNRQMFEAMVLGPVLSMLGTQKLGNFLCKSDQKDLTTLAKLLEAGKLVPVVDKRYPLAQAAEALRYLEQGHPAGKVVVTVAPSLDDARSSR